MPKHVYEIYIRASAETVWNALTDPDVTERYFHNTRAVSSWQPGEAWAMQFADGRDALIGEILEADPPRRLVTTFSAQYDAETAAERPSRCTWEIDEFGSQCRVRLTHDDFHGVTKTFPQIVVGWSRIISSLKSTLETGAPLDLTELPSAADRTPVDVDAEAHRELGRATNGRAWELIGVEHRTPEQDRELIDVAHASNWHWKQCGTMLNEQRGEWMISHVYAVVGFGEAALRHAQRCWEITETASLDGFDLVYAHEALARAYAALGRADDARSSLARARVLAEQVADPEDRGILDSDLSAEPWYGVD